MRNLVFFFLVLLVAPLSFGVNQDGRLLERDGPSFLLKVREKRNSPQVIQDLNCSCEVEKTQKFEEPLRYSRGRLAGQCIDSCRFRVPRRITDKSEGDLIYNLLHRGRYWKFKAVDLEVDGVSLLFERFLDPISHVALRFRLGKPLPIQPLNGGRGEVITDLVYSPEAAVPKDQLLKLVPSIFGDYIFIHRLLSLEAAQDWMIITQKHKVDQFELNLDPKKGRLLIHQVLDRSTQAGASESYWLFKRNCSTVVADLLLDSKLGPLEELVRILPVPVNLGLLHVLKKKNVLRTIHGIEARSLNDELAHRKSHTQRLDIF